jgi:hypothetical protein
MYIATIVQFKKFKLRSTAEQMPGPGLPDGLFSYQIWVNFGGP